MTPLSMRHKLCMFISINLFYIYCPETSAINFCICHTRLWINKAALILKKNVETGQIVLHFARFEQL